MAAKLSINLTIAGEVFPMTIESEKEERYRRAEREINALVAAFEAHYVGDTQKFLAMAAFHLAVNNIESEMSRNLDSERDKLVELDRELDNYINSLK